MKSSLEAIRPPDDPTRCRCDVIVIETPTGKVQRQIEFNKMDFRETRLLKFQLRSSWNLCRW